MTANHSTAATLLVAIDISKHRHDVLIGTPGKKRRRRMTITNTLEDFQRLSAALASYELPVRIGFEATGNYHRTLAYHLGRSGFELKLVSSVGLARTREALHNSWDKNDPKDAQVILHMLEIGAVQFFHEPLMSGTADIQELSKTHEIVSRSKTELWHRILTHYLPLYFPEAERFHRSSRTDWFLAFLEKYPSPHMIAGMSRDAFIADAWGIIGRKVSKDLLLSDIYATAVGSVGLPLHPGSDAVRMFRLVLAEGRSLIRQRDEIEARAVELLSDLPDYQLLTTIPGIGPINAMTILAEAGDLRRFRHHRQFLKFCGMDLATVQSDMFRGQTELTREQHKRKSKRYPSDLTDAEWAIVSPLLPGANRLGRPRTVDLRRVWDAIQYLAAAGCAWSLLPKDFPPVSTVRYYFYSWRNGGLLTVINRELVSAARRAEGRDAPPTAGVIDSQSVKTSENTSLSGFDAGKRIKG